VIYIIQQGEITSVMIRTVGHYLRVTNQIKENEKSLSDEEIGEIRFKQKDGFFNLYNDAEKYFNKD
jgi:predicted double-glycine peptidase